MFNLKKVRKTAKNQHIYNNLRLYYIILAHMLQYLNKIIIKSQIPHTHKSQLKFDAQFGRVFTSLSAFR